MSYQDRQLEMNEIKEKLGKAFPQATSAKSYIARSSFKMIKVILESQDDVYDKIIDSDNYDKDTVIIDRAEHFAPKIYNLAGISLSDSDKDYEFLYYINEEVLANLLKGKYTEALINAIFLDYIAIKDKQKIEEETEETKETEETEETEADINSILEKRLPAYSFEEDDAHNEVFKHVNNAESKPTEHTNALSTYYLTYGSVNITLGNKFFGGYCKKETSFINPGLREVLLFTMPNASNLMLNNDTTKTKILDSEDLKEVIDNAYEKILSPGGNENSSTVNITDSIEISDAKVDKYYIKPTGEYPSPFGTSVSDVLFNINLEYGQNEEEAFADFDLSPFLMFCAPKGQEKRFKSVAFNEAIDTIISIDFFELRNTLQRRLVIDQMQNWFAFLGMITKYNYDTNLVVGRTARSLSSDKVSILNDLPESAGGYIETIKSQIRDKETGSSENIKKLEVVEKIYSSRDNVINVANIVKENSGRFGKIGEENKIVSMAKFLCGISSNRILDDDEFTSLLSAVGERSGGDTKGPNISALIHYQYQTGRAPSFSVAQETVEENFIRKKIRNFLIERASLGQGSILKEGTEQKQKIETFIDDKYKVDSPGANTYWASIKGKSEGKKFVIELKKLSGDDSELNKDSQFSAVKKHLKAYAVIKKNKDSIKKNRQTFAFAIVNEQGDATWGDWFTNDYDNATSGEQGDVKTFYAWVLENGNANQKEIAKSLPNASELTNNDIDGLITIFEGGKYTIVQDGAEDKEIEVESLAPEYLQSAPAKAAYGIDPKVFGKGQPGEVELEDEKSGAVADASAEGDPNERQAEIDYGYVGTFLRASITISTEPTVIVGADETEAEEADKDLQKESRIRRAIRSILLEEIDQKNIERATAMVNATAQSLKPNIKGKKSKKSKTQSKDSQNPGTKIGMIEYEPFDTEITVSAIQQDLKLKEKLVNLVCQPGFMGNTTWAIFATFDKPNVPYYAFCIDDPNGNIKGMSFNVAGISQLGSTTSNLYGKAKEFISTDQSVIEFAIANVLLNSLKTESDYAVDAERSLETGEMSSSWNTQISGIGSLTYKQLAVLFAKKDFKSDAYNDSMKIIVDHMKDKNKLYDLVTIDTNALGVLTSGDLSIVENAKAKNIAAYREIIERFNAVMSTVCSPGEKVEFTLVKKSGVSRGIKFKSSNPRHEKVLNSNTGNSYPGLGIITTFLGTSALNLLMDTEGFKRNKPDDGEEASKRINIDAPISLYTRDLDRDDSSSAREMGCKKVKNGTYKISGNNIKVKGPLGYKILPMLNEKQFFSVLVNFYTGGTDNRKTIKKAIRDNLKDFKSLYVSYRENYTKFIKNDVFRDINDMSKSGLMGEFKQEYDSVLSGRSKTLKDSSFFIVLGDDSQESIILQRPARGMRKRERDTTERLDRKTALYYIHAPGIGNIDPYEKFIKEIIINCTNKNSAAENVTDEDVKIFESVVNRHQTLYNIYLKNKAKNIIKSKIVEAKIKKKIRSLLVEKYEEGDVMIGSFADALKSKSRSKKRYKRATAKAGEKNLPPKTDKGLDPSGKKPTPKQQVNEPKKDINKNSPKKPGVEIADSYKETPVDGGETNTPVSNVSDVIWPVKSRHGVMLNSCASEKRQTEDEETPDAHHGNDIKGAEGEEVVAIKDGTVTFAGNFGTYGNVVIITHDKFISMYAHMDSIAVKKGQRVKQGIKIGEVGRTGRTSGPHLHLEIRNLDNQKNVETSVKFLRNFDNELKFNGLLAEKEYKKIIAWYDAGKPNDHPITGSKAKPKIDKYDPDTGKYDVDEEPFQFGTADIVLKDAYFRSIEMGAIYEDAIRDFVFEFSTIDGKPIDFSKIKANFGEKSDDKRADVFWNDQHYFYQFTIRNCKVSDEFKQKFSPNISHEISGSLEEDRNVEYEFVYAISGDILVNLLIRIKNQDLNKNSYVDYNFFDSHRQSEKDIKYLSLSVSYK